MTTNMKGESATQVEPEIKLSSINMDEPTEVQINAELGWIKDVIDVVEEDLDEDEKSPEGMLQGTLRLARFGGKPYGDHLVVSGALKLKYNVACVRCLLPSPQNKEIEVAACYLHPKFDKDPEFKDSYSVWADERDCDMYFYEKGVADLSEFIREQAVMSKDELPLHDENCKGLCQTCGANLNTEQCKHHQN